LIDFENETSSNKKKNKKKKKKKKKEISNQIPKIGFQVSDQFHSNIFISNSQFQLETPISQSLFCLREDES